MSLWYDSYNKILYYKRRAADSWCLTQKYTRVGANCASHPLQSTRDFRRNAHFQPNRNLPFLIVIASNNLKMKALIEGVSISAIDLLFSYHRKCFGMIPNYSIVVPDFHP